MNYKKVPNLRNRLQLATILTLLFLILFSAFSGYTALPAWEETKFETIELPPEALSLDSTTEPTSPRHSKLDSALADVARAAKDSTAKAMAAASSQLLKTSKQKVQVHITTHAQGLENAVEAVTHANGEVTGTGFNDTLIQAWLPVTSLETVAAEEDVYYISRPAEPILFETDATTEGLAVMNGPAWHSGGYQGAGVKVGIIDSGFQGYTSLLGTDLPTTVTVKNFVDGEWIGFHRGGDETLVRVPVAGGPSTTIVATPGSTNRRDSVRRNATGSTATARTTALVFVSPRTFPISLFALSFYPFL